MKKLLLLLLLLSLPCTLLAVGSVSLFDSTRFDTFTLTDAKPSSTVFVKADSYDDIYVDIAIDKGCTVVITPVLSSTDKTYLGVPSDPLVITNGGATSAIAYNNIVAEKAKIIVTKTEAGDTSVFKLSVRGSK